MIELNNAALYEKTYSTIFIVENRNLWEGIAADKNTDLILCIDFGLKKELEDSGYQVEFLDHLVSNNVLNPLNFEMHRFLRNWFKGEGGNDLLHYSGLDMGDAHLLHIINEVNYFCHFLFNALAIKYLKHQQLLIATKDKYIIDSLNLIEVQFKAVQISVKGEVKPSYAFPILEWVAEKTQKRSFTRDLKNKLANLFDHTFKFLDPIINRGKKFVYIHRYYPTAGVIAELQKVKGTQLVYNNYSGLDHILSERRIHYGTKENSAKTAAALLNNFIRNRSSVWKYDEYDVSGYLYGIIENVLREKLPSTVDAANSINSWFKKYKINLMVPITNLWTENRLLMKYCQANNVPVFMIANGMLTLPFYEDGKDSNYVNCYSESVKEQYFNNSAAAIALGDPRMDGYASLDKKDINYHAPVVVVGTAGYNPVDLNSYLAVEFDFLYDILFNIEKQVSNGKPVKVILKIRGNGYMHLYRSFVDEYFAGLDVELIQHQSFLEVIKRADLYISIYSQTLFEASCMGIPVIYYKKDTQLSNKPFDGNSELVTPVNSKELDDAITGFFERDERFELFKRKEVMEKYIGYLDGGNTKRNTDFIIDLLN